MKWEKLNLENIASGVAKELFERELEKVLENIQDPNVDTTRNREINLKFVFTPDKKRDSAGVAVYSSAKLAPVMGAVGSTHFGAKGGKLSAYTQDVRQMNLDLEEEDSKQKEIKLIGE